MALGLMKYANNFEIDREQREIFDSARSMQENRATALPSNLAAQVQTCWQAAHQARSSSGIDEIMLQCFRQREGMYDPEDESDLDSFGGSKIYVMLTDVKSRAFGGLVAGRVATTRREAMGHRADPIPGSSG